MTRRLTIAAALVLSLGLSASVSAQERMCASTYVALDPANVDKDRAELSAVIVEQDRLITISNESIAAENRQHSLQIYRGTPSSGYRFERDVELFTAAEGRCGGADFEGLASSSGHVYAITSHARLDAKKAKKRWSIQKLADELGDEPGGVCSSRYQLHRFKLTADGTLVRVQQTSLRNFIENHPQLHDAARLPNKSGGVDIEGLAATADALYVGFRGPVSKTNLVPVLKLPLELDDGSQRNAVLQSVMLDGRGIRGMAAGPDGIYILAGPTGGEAVTFSIYLWDGADQTANPARGPAKVCNLGLHDGSKPEGIAFVDQKDGTTRLMLVFDGPPPLKAVLVNVPPAR